MFHIIKYMCFTAKTYIAQRYLTAFYMTVSYTFVRNCRSQQLENTETNYILANIFYIEFFVLIKPFNPSTADIISIVACYNKDKS